MAENKHIAGKEKTAVAVAYNPGEVAPKILAVGKGEVAERIIETAKENDVPFYQDNKLAETLSRLQIGDTIPPELYEVVAERENSKNPAYCRQMTDAVMVTEGTGRTRTAERGDGSDERQGERIPDEQAADGNSV